LHVSLAGVLKRVNLPAGRLHALRAYFVTTLLNGHVPVHVVRELVRHGDLATTQRYGNGLDRHRVKHRQNQPVSLWLP
jgi:site-specific recombinase XerD